MIKRLLDHEQVEIIQRSQMILVRQRVGTIRIDRKQNLSVSPPHLSYDINVPARFDLQFDSLITEGKVFVHAFQELIETRLNAKTNTDGHSFTHSSDQLR